MAMVAVDEIPCLAQGYGYDLEFAHVPIMVNVNGVGHPTRGTRYNHPVPDMYGEFDRPASEPVIGGLDAEGHTFLEVALEEMEIEADTLAALAQR
jgi:hypothetical protein